MLPVRHLSNRLAYYLTGKESLLPVRNNWRFLDTRSHPRCCEAQIALPYPTTTAAAAADSPTGPSQTTLHAALFLGSHSPTNCNPETWET